MGEIFLILFIAVLPLIGSAFLAEDKEIRVAFAVLSIIAIFCCSLIAITGLQEEYSEKQYDIYTLNSGTVIDGSFVLGSGTIDTHIAYFYYAMTENGYKKEMLVADGYDIFIVEDNSKTPSVYKVKDKWEIDYYYVIYVPEGTIIKEYNG